MRDSFDVAVLGGGPVGCSLALALLGAGHSVSMLERRPHAAQAPLPARAQAPLAARAGAPLAARPIVLSYASRLILERIGAWRELSAAAGPTPIETILVSRQGFGRTRLDAADARVPALGYVVEYEPLAAALVARAQAAGIAMTFGAETLSLDRRSGETRLRYACEGASREIVARCVVHAEGVANGKAKAYAHDALVALVTTEPAARTTAYERFTGEGPLAMLPMAARYALVWSMRPERAEALARADDAGFLEQLARACGARAGRLIAVEERNRVQLAPRVRSSRVAEREVFIGNAAQTLHPVAGQGLNLGLRDSWELAAVLRDAADPGERAALQRYAAGRRLDSFATIRVTDLLATAFLGANPVLGAARGLLMTALDTIAPARRFFARRMIYGPSAIP